MDSLYKNLRISDQLQEMIPKLIEVFVDYYGEENREFITNRFQNTLVIGYQSLDTKENMITSIKKKYSKKVASRVLGKNNIDATEENITKYFTNYLNYDYIKTCNLYEIDSFVTSFFLGKEGRKERERKSRYERFLNYIPDLDYESFIAGIFTEEQLKKIPSYIKQDINYWINDFNTVEQKYETSKEKIIPILSNIYPDITKDNLDEFFLSSRVEQLKKLCIDFKESIKEYEEYISLNLKKFIDEYNKMEEAKDNADKKNKKTFYEEFLYLLKETDQNDIKKSIDKDGSIWNDGLSKVLSNSLTEKPAIYSFSKESDDQLSDPSTNDYNITKIKNQRIAFFKYYGIDLGNDYEAYANNEECKKIWPNHEVVEHINERRLFYLNQANIDYCINLDLYKEVKEKMDKIGMVNKGAFQPTDILCTTTAVIPNYRRTENGYELYSLLMIHGNGEPSLDEYIIHELNHLFELYLIRADEKSYECICGWDTISESIGKSDTFDDTTVKSEDKREYELINEIFNEFIAQEIAVNMHSKGIYLFCEEGKAKDKGNTSYERCKFLSKEFFEDYKEAIFKSRKDGNIKIITDLVGKDNFKEFSALYKEFNEAFPGFSYFKLIEEMRDNKDTPKTRKFNEIMEKRNIVLARMKEYSTSLEHTY